MTVSTPLSGVNHPFKGILLIVLATFLFSSHDALSKYLAGFYPIVMVVWARYMVHTLLMAGIFLPQSGLRVLRSKRVLAQSRDPYPRRVSLSPVHVAFSVLLRVSDAEGQRGFAV